MAPFNSKQLISCIYTIPMHVAPLHLTHSSFIPPPFLRPLCPVDSRSIVVFSSRCSARGEKAPSPALTLHYSMASSQVKHARVTLVLENVKEFRSIKSGDTQVPEEESDCKPSSVVEHLVLFSMPYLQGDQEAAILRALYDLQFQFENINVLIVGRVLNKVENITHALFMRFPKVEILQAYYKSDVLSNVAAIMVPHLHGEITVDYVSATGYLDTHQRDPICATATFLRRKRDVCPDEVDCALHSLVAAVDDVSFVKDFTVGSNLFLRGDKFYTHGFSSYVKSVGDLDKLAEDSAYTKVLHQKVLPLCSSTITVNVMAFKPISSAL